MKTLLLTVAIIVAGSWISHAETNWSAPPLAEIAGHSGSAFDAGMSAGAAPTNGLGILAQYNSSAPAPTAAQTLSIQAGPNANLLVQPFRRSQIAATAGSINATSAATMIAAGASGVFDDITTLVLTQSAESTAAYITVTVSDGTKSYAFGYACEADGTAGSGNQPIAVNFNPPLPETSAATAWTIKESAADCTVQYTAEYVTQTANF